uniref:DUF834 domain-containing protein n=1 Tax=Oryza meridionalis TaxID=40149 RepID=A0A0E0DAP5_9ORYZ
MGMRIHLIMQLLIQLVTAYCVVIKLKNFHVRGFRLQAYFQLVKGEKALAEELDGERDENQDGVPGGYHEVDHGVGDELVGELIAGVSEENVDGVPWWPSLPSCPR